jgi:CDP-diacylglycerol--glycerol-3-phosphate 3-phosphatidyltransferase
MEVPILRERFWNLPNTITMVRMIVIPVLVGFPMYADWAGSHVMAWLYIIAAVGDLVDGWAARRGQQITRIGKLLDPLADKLTVSTALIVLLAMGRIPSEGWMGILGVTLVVVIVGRELAVTGLRGIASAGGVVVSANWAGKAKTLSQNIAMGFLLFPEGTLGIKNHEIGVLLLVLAATLTLWSGYVYFADYFRAELTDTDRTA